MLSLKDRLCEILINNKLITRAQLEQALKSQADRGGNLSDIITGLGFIDYSQLSDALNKGLNMPLFDLKYFEIDANTVKIIPLDTARRYQVILLSKSTDTFSLAMADPLNIFAIENFPQFRGMKINPVITSSHDIKNAIELYYPAVFKANIDDLLKESEFPVEITIPEKDVLFSSPELERISREVSTIRAANAVLDGVIKKKASEVLIEPLENKLRVRFRIGRLFKDEDLLPKDMHASIIARLKVISELDINEHNIPQEGRFKANFSGGQLDFGVSILPTVLGEKAVLRVLDKTQAGMEINDLGLSSYAAGVLTKASRLTHGMVLVCGPSDSGKTTTLYALLKSLNSLDKNIVTLEDPVEFHLEGVNQVSIKPGIGFTFAAGLRSILLQDPNIIMIGEIRDYETLDIAIKSALTGHLVFASLNSSTASGAVAQLANMGVEPYLINSSLVCVIAQRLLRTLCSHCKEAYIPGKEVISGLGINPHKAAKAQFYKAKGCPHCFNSGYLGRALIAEVLQLSPKIHSLILSNADERLIKQQACLEGMQTLRQAGFDAVLKGQTTIEEALRVSAPEA